MKRLPQILLIALLLSAGIAKAQSGTEVYEYATVAGGFIAGSKPGLLVSFSNGEYKEIEVAKNEFKAGQTAYLKYIAQMSKEGWEVINSQPGGIPGSWAYFLKRKQK